LSAALQRFPVKRKTSRRLKRPLAVRTGAGSAARGITECAAAIIAGALPAEGVNQRVGRSGDGDGVIEGGAEKGARVKPGPPQGRQGEKE
jgi:hypothetical protein